MTAEDRKKWALKITRVVTGCVLIVLGVLGLFLPVLQGILFLTLGSLLLAVDLPPFRRGLQYLRGRFPAIKKPLREGRRWLFRKKHKN